MNYWVARGGQKQGPYSIEDVQRMLAAGSITTFDLAWHEGMPQWLPVGQVIPPGSPGTAPGGFPPGVPAPGFTAPMPPPGYGFAQQVALPPRPGTPIPPNLHWALVLLFGILTGLFTTVWMFVQANFVKKIDPRSNAIMLLIGALVLPFAYIAIVIVSVFSNFSQFPSESAIENFFTGEGIFLLLLIFPVVIGMAVCYIMAWFSMRSSLVNYYNSTEPIGLRLSGVMTFFFNIYYFQYHFSRIAEWKSTGRLTPQQ